MKQMQGQFPAGKAVIQLSLQLLNNRTYGYISTVYPTWCQQLPKLLDNLGQPLFAPP